MTLPFGRPCSGTLILLGVCHIPSNVVMLVVKRRINNSRALDHPCSYQEFNAETRAAKRTGIH